MHILKIHHLKYKYAERTSDQGNRNKNGHKRTQRVSSHS